MPFRVRKALDADRRTVDQSFEPLLSRAALGDVERRTAHAHGLPVGADVDSAACGNPAHTAVRKQYAAFLLVGASGFERMRERFAYPGAVFRMDEVQHVVEMNPLPRVKADKGAASLGDPEFITCGIPLPCAYSGSQGRLVQPPFALAKRGFALFQIRAELAARNALRLIS